MAFIQYHLFSFALQMQTTVNIILPQQNRFDDEPTAAKPLKCLYLLHGLSDDQSIWLRRSSIERYADQYNLCVIMPNGAKSFYTDMKYGEKYYTYIAHELPFVLRQCLNISAKREDTYIAGLSMGGYGALKISLKNPERYCAAIALSPVADINLRAHRDDFKAIFGEVSKAPDSEDLFYLSKQCAQNEFCPKLFIGIGLEDGLYEETSRLVKQLKELNYTLTYRESHGAHTWDFWDEYIQYGLKWLFY